VIPGDHCPLLHILLISTSRKLGAPSYINVTFISYSQFTNTCVYGLCSCADFLSFIIECFFLATVTDNARRPFPVTKVYGVPRNRPSLFYLKHHEPAVLPPAGVKCD